MMKQMPDHVATGPKGSEEISQFIQDLSKPRFEHMFNPWSQGSDSELNPQGFSVRRERLRVHLSTPCVKLVLIGEAAGYQGCRFTGMAFTSERLILEGKIPRIGSELSGRISARHRPWSEPSATIVWLTLDELNVSDSTVLFNAVPWHPEGSKGPLSNRRPTAAEKEAGAPFLKRFLRFFPGVPVAALGNIASETLLVLGVAHHKVRHPAYGGAVKFREGLRILLKGQ